MNVLITIVILICYFYGNIFLAFSICGLFGCSSLSLEETLMSYSASIGLIITLIICPILIISYKNKIKNNVKNNKIDATWKIAFVSAVIDLMISVSLSLMFNNYFIIINITGFITTLILMIRYDNVYLKFNFLEILIVTLFSFLILGSLDGDILFVSCYFLSIRFMVPFTALIYLIGHVIVMWVIPDDKIIKKKSVTSGDKKERRN